MLSEVENQAGAVSIASLVSGGDGLLDKAAEGVMGAWPFRIGEGGSKVDDVLAAWARDGRRVGPGGSGAELAEKRAERRVGVDSFSVELRILFEAGSSIGSPALFLEHIRGLEFVVIEGDGFAWLIVDMTRLVVDGSGEAGGDTGREGGSEMGGEGGGDTGREGGSEPGRGGTSFISMSGP